LPKELKYFYEKDEKIATAAKRKLITTAPNLIKRKSKKQLIKTKKLDLSGILEDIKVELEFSR
jgi:hypothetical protein